MNRSKIEWLADGYTWNPITGCTPASEGCQHCYAKALAEGRLRGRCGYDADFPFDVAYHPERLDEPEHVKEPSMIFVCSMGDLFHSGVKRDWQVGVMAQVPKCEQHTFFVLTKRPANMRSYFNMNSSRAMRSDNLWLGVSVENQQAAERIDSLLAIPAKHRFISVEPMLGPVMLSGEQLKGLDWVICGCETGKGARPMATECYERIRRQCALAEVPFFAKKVSHGEQVIREYPKSLEKYVKGAKSDGADN